MKSRVVAVTGATGLLGRHLCDHLSAAGWEVRALVRDPDAPHRWRPGVRAFRCILPDEIDPESFRGADAVIHCAYMTRFTSVAEARRVNEEGTLRLVDEAARAGVKRFVFVSSTSAHPDAASYYGRSKLSLESRLDPTSSIVIRPGLILAADGGLFRRIADSIRKLGIVPLFWGGRQVLQTVHVDDLCAAFERAISRDLTGILTVAEPDGLTMREFLELTAAHLGRRPFAIRLPAGLMLLALQSLERLHVPLPVSSENLLGLKAMRHMSTRESLSRLGLKVRTTRESLRALA